MEAVKEAEAAKEYTSEDNIIEKETEKMLTKKRKFQEAGQDDDKFRYNKKGKLTRKEVMEIKKTHINIMTWVKKEQEKVAEKDSFEKAIEDEPMEMETEHDRLEKEQRIARMMARQKSFASKRLVK